MYVGNSTSSQAAALPFTLGVTAGGAARRTFPCRADPAEEKEGPLGKEVATKPEGPDFFTWKGRGLLGAGEHNRPSVLENR